MSSSIGKIEYDKKKLSKSESIMYDKKSGNLMITSSKYKEKVKKTIYDILSVTNIDYNFFDKNKKCILTGDLVKHILSTVSQDISHHEKIEIIKESIKDIIKLPTHIAIFIGRGKIVLIDTGKKIIYNGNRKEKTDKVRFNGYDEKILEDIVEDLFGISYSGKKVIRELLVDIDISSYSNTELTSFLKQGYKGYCLNKLCEQIINLYDAEKDVAIAVAGYLLRSNFSEAKSIIIEKYTELLINYIESNNLDDTSLSKISILLLNNYSDLNSIKLEVVNKIINSIFNDIKLNNGNISSNIKLFFTFLHNKGITIKLRNSEIEYDVIDIIQKIRNIILKITQLESSISKLKENIDNLEKYIVTKSFIKEKERLIRENKDFIENSLSNLDMNNGINSIFELKKKYEDEAFKINNIISNLKFKALQGNKVKKLMETKKDLLKKIELIGEIKDKYEENNKLSSKINKYKDDIRLFTSNKVKLQNQRIELEKFQKEILNIKKVFVKSILDNNK